MDGVCDTSVTTEGTRSYTHSICWYIVQKKKESKNRYVSLSHSVSCPATLSKMINCLCGPGESEKSTKMLRKKLSNTNNDMLYYNFPASCSVLASTKEFLQSQTCYCNSSSNYNFSPSFTIYIRPQSLFHLIAVCTACCMCLRVCSIFI